MMHMRRKTTQYFVLVQNGAVFYGEWSRKGSDNTYRYKMDERATLNVFGQALGTCFCADFGILDVLRALDYITFCECGCVLCCAVHITKIAFSYGYLHHAKGTQISTRCDGILFYKSFRKIRRR